MAIVEFHTIVDPEDKILKTEERLEDESMFNSERESLEELLACLKSRPANTPFTLAQCHGYCEQGGAYNSWLYLGQEFIDNVYPGWKNNKPVWVHVGFAPNHAVFGNKDFWFDIWDFHHGLTTMALNSTYDFEFAFESLDPKKIAKTPWVDLVRGSKRLMEVFGWALETTTV